MAKVKLLHTELIYVWEIFISQLYNNAHNESTSFRLGIQNNDLKRLDKLEIKFTEEEKKVNMKGMKAVNQESG